MKIWDIYKLVIHEYRYEKMEWMVSIILHILIFSCELFLLSIAFNIDNIGSNYLKRLYPDGYTFTLKGYSTEDQSELENMGFYELAFDKSAGSGTLNNLDGIWIKKMNAAVHGKDIWNEEIDEFLIVIGSFQVTFGVICFVMLIVMINNISNSFIMKLTRRSNYIKMLFQLGCSSRICKKIYYEFFNIRNFIALFVALMINARLIVRLNRYLYCKFFVDYKIQTINWFIIFGFLIIVELMMRIAFNKIWSKRNETS